MRVASRGTVAIFPACGELIKCLCLHVAGIPSQWGVHGGVGTHLKFHFHISGGDYCNDCRGAI